MAHFYGELQGQRGEATRLGSVSSGIRCHVRGWNVGVAIDGDVDQSGDYFDVYATRGSHGAGSRTLLGRVRLDSGGNPHMIAECEGITLADPSGFNLDCERIA